MIKFHSVSWIIVLLLSTLFGCRKNQEVKADSRDENPIVVVFNDPVENWKFQLESGRLFRSYPYEVSYFSEGMIPVFWSPQYGAKSDTLVIDKTGENFELIVKYRGYEKLYYIFQPGDTVLFNYTNGFPVAQIENRSVPFKDLNFHLLSIDTSDIHFLRPATKHEYYIMSGTDELILSGEKLFEDSNVDLIVKKLKKIRKRYKQEALVQIQREDELLSSFLQEELISYKFYSFRKEQNRFLKKKLDLEAEIGSKGMDFFLPKSSDSLLQYSFYRDYVDEIAKLKIIDKVAKINGYNFSHPNYLHVYDSIVGNKFLSKKVKRYLLFGTMESIIENHPVSDLNKYFERFRSDGDSLQIVTLEHEYNLKGEVSEHLKLVNIDGDTLTLASLLENQKELLYIDFWASWCAPCRRAMPDLEALREQYKDSPIQFIYLSLDSDKSRWLKAVRQHDLTEYKHNYLIVNQKTSRFIEENSIKEIPRYMIFKDRRIIDQTAPSPEKESLPSLINSYLTK